MKCVTSPTTTLGPCVPCIHPLEYLFEKAYLATTINNNRQKKSLYETLEIMLDKGIIFPNCGYCCPNCEGVYFLGRVDTFVCNGDDEETQACIDESNGGKFANKVGIAELAAAAIPTYATFGTLGTKLLCCSNVHASVETKIGYDEAMGFASSAAVAAQPIGANLGNQNFSDTVTQCCDGFDSCVDDLICWATANSKNSADVIDRLLDIGIVEYGVIENNCNNTKVSSICKLVELLEKYYDDRPVAQNVNKSSRINLLDMLFNKAIVISCDEQGNLVIASSDTWLAYAEIQGLLNNTVIPAIPQITTTTTTVI